MSVILAAKFLFAASVAMAGAAVLALTDELALLAASKDARDQVANRDALIVHGERQ